MNHLDARTSYSAAARSLHWLMALCFVGLFISGALMVEFEKTDSLRAAFYSFHKSMGVLSIALLILRLAIRLRLGAPAYRHPLSALEHLLAHAGHLTLYVLMVIIPLTGWAMSNFFGYSVELFGVPMPQIVAKNTPYGVTAGVLHTWLAYSLLSLVVLHLLAVAKHRYLDKACVMHRMA